MHRFPCILNGTAQELLTVKICITLVGEEHELSFKDSVSECQFACHCSTWARCACKAMQG